MYQNWTKIAVKVIVPFFNRNIGHMAGATVPGPLWQGHCARVSVPGPLCQCLCAGATVPGPLCQGHCSSASVPGPLCQCLCAGATVPVPLCRGHCASASVPGPLCQDCNTGDCYGCRTNWLIWWWEILKYWEYLRRNIEILWIFAQEWANASRTTEFSWS